MCKKRCVFFLISCNHASDTDISLSDSFSVDDEYLSCLSDEVLLNEEVKITERTDDKSDCGNDLSEDRGETKVW